MNHLDEELNKCLEAEKDAIADSALSARDGVGENIIVALYELGSVGKDYIYSARSKDDEIIRARAVNSINEFSDVITQSLIAFAKLKKYTNSMKDMSVEQLILDGLERQQFRMGEIKRREISYK